MNKEAGQFEGLDRFEARKAVVAGLEELGLLVKVEDYRPQRSLFRPRQGAGGAAALHPVVCQCPSPWRPAAAKRWRSRIPVSSGALGEGLPRLAD